jgi:hypothetical protein
MTCFAPSTTSVEPPAIVTASVSTGMPPLSTMTVKFMRIPRPAIHIPAISLFSHTNKSSGRYEIRISATATS